MWNETTFLRWFGHALASALAVGVFIGALAMWTYDPAVTTEAQAIERMTP